MNETTSAHSAIVGGSNAGRLITCPGSRKLIAAMPNLVEAPSFYAAEGTVCHDIVRDELTGVEKFEEAVGVYECDGHEIVVDEELLQEAVAPCFDFLDSELFDAQTYLVEKKLPFPGLPGVFGTCDLIAICPTRIAIVDWKFGKGVKVNAEYEDGSYNSQLGFYSTCAYGAYAHLFEGKEVDAYICQPRAAREEGAPIWSKTHLTHEDLDDFRGQLNEAVRLSNLDNAPLKESHHCRFCPAKPGCPEFTKPLLDDFDMEPTRSALVTSANGMNPAYPRMLERALALSDRLELFVSEARRHAQLYLEGGGELDGWKLVDKRAMRKWRDDAEADKALARLGLKVGQRRKTVTVSPAQAEKALKPLGKPLPAHLVVAESSGTTLAPAKDRRPDALPSSQLLTDFGAALDDFVNG